MDTPLPITCPYCDQEILVPGDSRKFSCTHCGKKLDVNSQFAYLRGLDAFKEGQEIFQKINPKKRRVFFASEREALDIFLQAYSSLQVAFKADLEENQRKLAVEMMCSMTQEFLRRLMVSPLEAQYWNTIMVEQTARYEYDGLKQKLNGEKSGILEKIKHFRWNARKKKLAQIFIQLDEKIMALEKQIDFLDIPRARNMSWKP